jgi:hypothetical protein
MAMVPSNEHDAIILRCGRCVRRASCWRSAAQLRAGRSETTPRSAQYVGEPAARACFAVAREKRWLAPPPVRRRSSRHRLRSAALRSFPWSARALARARTFACPQPDAPVAAARRQRLPRRRPRGTPHTVRVTCRGARARVRRGASGAGGRRHLSARRPPPLLPGQNGVKFLVATANEVFQCGRCARARRRARL